MKRSAEQPCEPEKILVWKKEEKDTDQFLAFKSINGKIYKVYDFLPCDVSEEKRRMNGLKEVWGIRRIIKGRTYDLFEEVLKNK